MADRGKVIKGLECCIKAEGKDCPRVCTFYNVCFPRTEHGCTPFFPVMRAALELLKEQPEQKHGHWIEQDDYNDTYYKCSVCGEPWVLIDGTPLENGMHFCPKCGARMESEVKQE